MTVDDVRGDLLALVKDGDRLRGGEWSAVEKWHSEVVLYVRSALGDGPAADVASRLRCTRGATQTEKESNAICFVNEWIGTQVIGLTADKIVPTFDGTVPEPIVEAVCEEVEPQAEPDVLVSVAAELEVEDGDAGSED